MDHLSILVRLRGALCEVDTVAVERLPALHALTLPGGTRAGQLPSQAPRPIST